MNTKLNFETADASGAPVDETVAVLVAHQVAKETASLNEANESLRAELAEATAQRDKALTDLDVAKAEAEAARQEFADFKADLAAKAEAEVRETERREAVAKLAPALLEGDDEAVTARVARWVAMDEASFASLLEDLASVAKPAAGGETKPKPLGGTNTDTAMSKGGNQPASTSVAGAARKLLIG